MEMNKELISKAKAAKTPEELLCLAKHTDSFKFLFFHHLSSDFIRYFIISSGGSEYLMPSMIWVTFCISFSIIPI